MRRVRWCAMYRRVQWILASCFCEESVFAWHLADSLSSPVNKPAKTSLSASVPRKCIKNSSKNSAIMEKRNVMRLLCNWKNQQIPNHGYLEWWNYRKQLLWTTETVLLRWVWICDAPKWVNCWEHSPDKNDLKDLEITGKRRNYWWLTEKSEMTTKSGKKIDIQFSSFKTQCWTFECSFIYQYTLIFVHEFVCEVTELVFCVI